VAASVASALKRCGIDAGVMKPVETGCRVRAGRLGPRDTLRLMKTAGVRDPMSLVNPYRFHNPVAPFVAAGLENKKIEPVKIISAYQKLSKRHNFMVVEGAGGIMVPLSRTYLYLDLAQDIGLPVLIVARPGLGTINHTLLTIAVLRARKIPIAGIVINYTENKKIGLAEKTNPLAIENISGVKIVGIIPFGSKDVSAVLDSLK
jgi:dethiobiotin synthetase